MEKSDLIFFGISLGALTDNIGGQEGRKWRRNG